MFLVPMVFLKRIRSIAVVSVIWVVISSDHLHISNHCGSFRFLNCIFFILKFGVCISQ